VLLCGLVSDNVCVAAGLLQKATKLHGKPVTLRSQNFANKMTGYNKAIHIASRQGHGQQALLQAFSTQHRSY
jgi:hypothetical protein